MSQTLSWTLTDVQALLPAARIQSGTPWRNIERVCTDSRQVQAGDCFVALRGERFDGHDHLEQAVQAGAVAVMVDCAPDRLRSLDPAVTVIRVEHTRAALGECAAAWRQRWGKTLLAVTGSNGKTTVTQMVAAILRAHWGQDALATEGNFNNDIGLPLTLLRLRDHHQVAVVELGMNHPGEIAQIAQWARPQAVLVNNAQREHQEFMKSVEAVARENASAFDHLADQGLAVFPADDVHTPLWQSLAGRHDTRTFGRGGQVDLVRHRWMDDHWRLSMVTPLGPLTLQLHMAGEHNLKNAQAAVALALAAGVHLVDIAQGLNAFRPVRGRSELMQIDWQGHAVQLFNDTYNANPDSVCAAIDTLAALPGPRLMVLGDMGEVGDQGPAFHAEVGAHAATRGIDHLFTLGELSRHASAAMPHGQHFDDMAALQHAVVQHMGNLGAVAIKGSRFMRMEQLVEQVLTLAGRKEASCC
ncbi:MAG: UDP-N-acetylmuramoylalanyl-D-glutamyl-2,6-diaminopimelate--D-alanyl-D-alanine ligase [Pseudomonadota bacterium]|jgi:UDP-N-acetylmuramoyl-tripeptide--D-alanyl-D-alanine ligase